MKRVIKEYFNYSRNEIKGLLVLVVLIIAVFILPTFLKHFRNEDITNFDEFKEQLNQFEENIKIVDDKLKKPTIVYFVFDPNTINYNELLRLGFHERQAHTLINYRNSGGKFIKPNDLKKIYTIDDVLYNKLKPFIRINPSIKGDYDNTSVIKKTKTHTHNENSVKKKEFKLIELNTADSITLMKLYGIGPILAQRIIKYRTHLGGYYKNNQLLEVYGLSSETFSEIENKISVDTLFIEKININSADFKTINRHPYIEYSDTKKILKYRKLMNEFSSISELLDNYLIDSATYNKVNYYLDIR